MASAVANLGTWMQNLTVPFVIYEITDSALWLSASVFAAFVPPFILSPISGALSDRYSPQRVLLSAQVFRVIGAAALAIAWQIGARDVLLLLAFVLVTNVGGGLHVVSWQAVVPSVVSQDLLANAVRLSALQNVVARAVGPAVGGAVLAAFGPSVAFGSNALSCVGVVLVLFRHQAMRVATVNRSTAPIMQGLIAGWRHMRTREAPRQAIVTIGVFYATAYAVVQMAPVVAQDLVGVDRSGYATLVFGHGAGAVLATALLTIWGDLFAPSRAVTLGLLTGLAGTAMLWFSTGLWSATACFLLIGLGQTLLMVAQNTAIMVGAEEDFRGRLISLYLMATIGAVPAGTAVLGAVTSWWSAETMLITCVATLGLFTMVSMRRYAGFQALDEPQHVPSRP